MGRNTTYMGWNKTHMGRNTTYLGWNKTYMGWKKTHMGWNNTHIGQKKKQKIIKNILKTYRKSTKNTSSEIIIFLIVSHGLFF